MHVIRWQRYFMNTIQHNFWGMGRRGWLRLQAGKSRVRFPGRSLEFFIDLILPAALCPGGSTQPLTEISTRGISWR
jgi:hypothetical protein